MKSLLLIFPIVLIVQVSLGQRLAGPEEDLKVIQEAIVKFSEHVMNGDAKSIAKAYSKDAKIFPTNVDILEGEAIKEYWTPSGDAMVSYHKILPEEITVEGNTAYDYGRYEGTTTTAEGKKIDWKGKYVIVWKKVKGQWKIYLDIWNRIK